MVGKGVCFEDEEPTVESLENLVDVEKPKGLNDERAANISIPFGDNWKINRSASATPTPKMVSVEEQEMIIEASWKTCTQMETTQQGT